MSLLKFITHNFQYLIKLKSYYDFLQILLGNFEVFDSSLQFDFQIIAFHFYIIKWFGLSFNFLRLAWKLLF